MLFIYIMSARILHSLYVRTSSYGLWGCLNKTDSYTAAAYLDFAAMEAVKHTVTSSHYTDDCL